MKKIFSILLSMALLSLILLIGSCSKSTSSKANNNGTVNGLIASRKQVNTTNGTSTTTLASYSYDGQNRLIQVQVTNQNPITFVYGSGTVTETQGNSVTVYTLSAGGLATSDNLGNTYTYNNGGYLTNKTNASGASTVNTISNGNIISSIQTSSTGTSTSYSYTFLGTTDFRSVGLAFLGAADLNVTQSEAISSIGTFSFSYTFDSQSRVQTQKYVSGNSTLVSTYTYAY